MDSVKLLRKVFILMTVLIVLVVFFLIFQLTDISFRVWDRLSQTPPLFLAIYAIGVSIIALAGIILIYKIWRLGKQKPQMMRPNTLTIDNVRANLEAARRQGIAVDDLHADLERASDEREPTNLEVAFFGKISTGKSSLIQTILPDATIDISIIGGTTYKVERYDYQMDSGLSLTFYDMPGTSQADALPDIEQDLYETVRRVHLVAYVLDQDITASDREAIHQLYHYDKPMIVILNKISRYELSERAALEHHITCCLPTGVLLVCADSAYEGEVSIKNIDGSLRHEKRLLGGNISELLQSLSTLGEKKHLLASKQRQALVALADESLQQRLHHYRFERGEAMVKGYARKAMLGGVAAVGPGTDILIQGYLGVDMMKALTRLYDVSVSEVDLHQMVANASDKVKSQLTVILALAGNVCKAFPGVGTVLGGAAHAVAYGLIFESLGKATLETLASNQANFNANTVMAQFEEQLHHDLEQRATKLLRLALKRQDKRDIT